MMQEILALTGKMVEILGIEFGELAGLGQLIGMNDINGVALRVGDIVAVGRVGDKIWKDSAVIIKCPLGVIEKKEYPRTIIAQSYLDLADLYSINPIRTGSYMPCEDNENYQKFLKYDTGHKLYLGLYDEDFYDWEDLRKIGNVNELDLPNWE